MDSGILHEPESHDLREEGGQGSRELGSGIRHGPGFPVRGGPVGGAARVVVHVVVSSGVG